MSIWMIEKVKILHIIQYEINKAIVDCARERQLRQKCPQTGAELFVATDWQASSTGQANFGNVLDGKRHTR